MSEQEDILVGKLVGKTTTHMVNLLIENHSIGRNDYLVIYEDLRNDSMEKKYYLLNITDIWNDKEGLMAKLKVLGHMPKRPFNLGEQVYLAKEEHITETLGFNNPKEESVCLGTLLRYPYEINLLVKNFGRIFITGKSGSGKSYSMGVLIEEFLGKGIPVVIFDRHGEYSSLKVSGDTSKSGEKVPSEYAEKIIEFTDLNMNEGGDIDIKYLFSLDASDLVASNLCTIINFRGLPLEVQEIVANEILMKLYNASTSKQLQPFYLFIDEAHLFAGKKKTETCETVKLFSQEGRKFGANVVLSTQKPQLLNTTIRSQTGSWIIHQLTDIRDIDITISSAEDLGPEYKEEIQRLEPGEAIICGDAVRLTPLFLKVRKRKTEHGGIGFNPLDFLSNKTLEDLKKRRLKIFESKSEGKLQEAESIFQEFLVGKTSKESNQELAYLRNKVTELEKEVKIYKEKYKKQELKAKKATKLAEESIDELKERHKKNSF